MNTIFELIMISAGHSTSIRTARTKTNASNKINYFSWNIPCVPENEEANFCRFPRSSSSAFYAEAFSEGVNSESAAKKTNTNLACLLLFLSLLNPFFVSCDF